MRTLPGVPVSLSWTCGWLNPIPPLSFFFFSFSSCREGSVEAVLASLASHPEQLVHTDSLGRNALHWAADGGHLDLVLLFLGRDASLVHAKDKDGCTPLHYACLCDYDAIAKAMIDNGADPEEQDKEGLCPRSIAPSFCIGKARDDKDDKK